MFSRIMGLLKVGANLEMHNRQVVGATQGKAGQSEPSPDCRGRETDDISIAFHLSVCVWLFLTLRNRARRDDCLAKAQSWQG